VSKGAVKSGGMAASGDVDTLCVYTIGDLAWLPRR
jgi:hypothetical protein